CLRPHRNGKNNAAVLDDPLNLSEPKARSIRVDLGLAARISDGSLASLVEHFRRVRHQKRDAPKIGGSRRDQTIENLSNLADVAYLHSDLIRDAISGKLGFSAWPLRRINRLN